MLSEATLSIYMLLNTYLDMYMSIKPNHTIEMTVNIHIQQTCCQSTIQHLYWITHTTLRHRVVQHLTRHYRMAYGKNIEGSNGPRPLLACWPVVAARCHDLHHVQEVISWCDNSPTGSGTSCGCDAWNLAHVYLARNRCLTYTHVSSQSCVHICEDFFIWIMCVNLAFVTNEHVYVSQ